MKKILISLSVIVAVAAIAVSGTIAYFSDTETSTGNTFAAGKLDLEIGEGQPVPFHVENVAPGQSGQGKITLTNAAGSIDGKLGLKFVNFQQFENGIVEPESQPIPGKTVDYEAGLNAGELNFFLGFVAFVDVNRNGIFDSTVDHQLDIQLAYNGQQMPFPGFWSGDFHYAAMSSNLTPWTNIMTLLPSQSVDIVIMWQFPTESGDSNYSQNIAMTDGLSFDIVASLDQVH